jgi:hypothetical protein
VIFGHNTNLTVGEAHYHVQTEDRGTSHAFIETTVYERGRLLHKRTIDYRSMLPLDSVKEASLKQRLDQQHRAVVEEIRSGALKLAVAKPKPTVAAALAPVELPGGPKLKLRIMNGADWLKAGKAMLKVRVTDELGNALPKAKVVAKMEGTADPVEVSSMTDMEGIAGLEFAIPKFAVADPFLVLEANWGPVLGRMRLQLKAKPKVPAV